MKNKKRIGIYAGTFDPVHLGHITFALQSIRTARLDYVYFLPERQPINKSPQELFGHRVAMLNRAIRPYKKFSVLEFDDKHFTVKKTLPKLQEMFNKAELVFLFGSDVVGSIQSWPNYNKILNEAELVIAIRHSVSSQEIKQIGSHLNAKNVYYINSFAPTVASSNIRLSLIKNNRPDGLLSSVARYIKMNWLYISIN